MFQSFAYLAGYWLGDGFYRSNHGYHQYVLVGNEDDRPRVEKAAREIGVKAQFRYHKSGHWYLIPGTEWNRDMMSEGFQPGWNSRTKRIPEQCFFWPEDLRWKLLEGLMDSDGSVSKRRLPQHAPLVTYATVAEPLAEDVRLLMEGLDLRTSKREYRLKTDWSKSPHIYHVRLLTKSLTRFKANTTLMDKKQARL